NFWGQIYNGIKVAIWIVTTWVPLQVIEKITRDIAGKDTKFTAAVSISLALSVFVSVAWAVSATKSRSRKNKILRLRGRIDQLEAELTRLKSIELGGEPK